VQHRSQLLLVKDSRVVGTRTVAVVVVDVVARVVRTLVRRISSLET
jgi:hypothetical protein